MAALGLTSTSVGDNDFESLSADVGVSMSVLSVLTRLGRFGELIRKYIQIETLTQTS